MTFEQQVAEALRALFREMRLVRAGREDDSLRWSADDLATDLAPRVAAAITAAAEAVNRTLKAGAAYEQEYGGVAYIGPGILEHAALSTLRGEAP